MPEHGDAAAVVHRVEHLVERGLGARHLQPDVEALGHPQFGHHRGELFAAHVDHAAGAVLGGHVEPVRLTSVMTTLRAPMWRTIAVAMMPIGPAPVISTSSPTTSKRSAVCVALPNGSSTAATLSSMCAGTTKTFSAGIDDVLGESAGTGDADAGVVVAELPPAAFAVAAMATRDVTFARDTLADLEPDDVGAELVDLAHELVADHHRHRDRSTAPTRPSGRCAGRCRRSTVLRTRISTSRSPGVGLGHVLAATVRVRRVL